MQFRPLHDRVVVRRIDAEEKTRGGIIIPDTAKEKPQEGEQKIGGIIIPDTAKEKPQQGKVYAVGAGKVKDDGTRQPLDVKDGDTILFGKYSGQEIKIDGDEYLILREEDVLGILD